MVSTRPTAFGSQPSVEVQNRWLTSSDAGASAAVNVRPRIGERPSISKVPGDTTLATICRAAPSGLVNVALLRKLNAACTSPKALAFL